MEILHLLAKARFYPMEMAPKFILFDIDGTLIGLDGAGRRALNRTMAQLTGILDGFKDINFAGKTDLQIVREGLKRQGLPHRGELPHSLVDLYIDYLRDEISSGKGQVKAGVRELLHELRGAEGFYLGLLTGNFEKGARAKLGKFGMNEFFPVGAFGSDREERNELLPIAVQRLRELESISLNFDQCVVVGDTPRDVECARIHGASCIAVATGPYPLARLKKAGADLAISDLSRTHEIMGWLMGL